MQAAILKIDQKSEKFEQMEWSHPSVAELRILRDGDRVSIFHRGICLSAYDEGDILSRNYCLVQLRLSSGFSLKEVSQLFGLQYQHCSMIIGDFKKRGLDGIRDESQRKVGTRRIITEKIGEFILKSRNSGMKYEEIATAIRFKFKKKISSATLRNWVCGNGKTLPGVVEQQVFSEEKIDQKPATVPAAASGILIDDNFGKSNIYAGSMILYSMLVRSGFVEVFEKHIVMEKKTESWSVRRVMLTLFFLHALRKRSVEQGKHLVGDDFSEIVGGDFLRLQWLRNAVDEIVSAEGFETAMNEHYKNLVKVVDREDKLFYTDGHFSTYYGRRPVPKGYDPRRQMPYRGRNTIYLHNSEGENVYLFESATNTSLSVDIETLVADMEKFEVTLKGQTLCFDRGGFSAKCFRFLRSKKMYFVSYLKNRKKERLVDEKLFETETIKLSGEEVTCRLYEKEPKETRAGKLRTIILLSDGKQIPILTTNPYLKAKEIVKILKQRWREENCFKYMTEHFGIDLLTSYKTEEAPDKIIERPHPQRREVNKELAEKKRDLEKLESDFAKRVRARGEQSDETLKEFCEAERDLNFSIKNVQVDIDHLERLRRSLPTKEKKSLKDDHVIMAQKRRLFINAIKAMNYNAEKWLQEFFKKFHGKEDETLSVIRNLFTQPGRIIQGPQGVRVELKPLDSGPMRQSLEKVLELLKENDWLKHVDGRNLEICQAH